MTGKTSNTDELIGIYMFQFAKGIFNFFKMIFYGIKKLPEKKSNWIGLTIAIAVGAGLFLLKENLWRYLPQDDKKWLPIKYSLYAAPFIPLLYLYTKGEEYVKNKESFDEKFDEIGLFRKGKKKNYDGEMKEFKKYPKLLGESKEREDKVTIYAFYSEIPLELWETKIRDLEVMLDVNILKIEGAKTTKKVVKIKTVPASITIPEYIEWKDEYLSENDFELIVGENMLEQIVFDLNKTPHVLVAGETGSGKSVILRLMLRQAVLKKARIYMIDFKGGVEFGKPYERYGEVITERQRALEMLKELTLENKARLNLFREMNVKNLYQYNQWAVKNSEKQLCRIIVFCDEVAEMMDKSGASKEEKAIFELIQKEISTLARLSRATGINLVLGMQRPDANVLTGQIKNNIPVRISGRFADKPASEIVLGNSEATRLPETKGRFVYKVGADTYQFQAYNFDDETMLTDIEVTAGGMLTMVDEEQEKKQEVIAEEEATKKAADRVIVKNTGIEDAKEADLEEDYEGF